MKEIVIDDATIEKVASALVKVETKEKNDGEIEIIIDDSDAKSFLKQLQEMIDLFEKYG